MLHPGSPPSSSYLCFEWRVASLEQQGGWHVMQGLQQTLSIAVKGSPFTSQYNGMSQGLNTPQVSQSSICKQ